MRIGIDLMGGENSPHDFFVAVEKAAVELGAAHTLLVIATKKVVEDLKPRVPKKIKDQSKIEFHVVRETIKMGDEPLGAVRRKKRSSIVVGISLLKRRRINAFVSSGNTGALVASATLSLSKLPGIKRPALLAMLPTETGSLAVIDVGGNVSCKAHHLVQFAQLGCAYQRSILGKKVPVVGLLNIGVESIKGTAEVQQAYEILNKMNGKQFQFLGNIEGRHVFQGDIDVLVTDGFTGNVLLKTTEGASDFIFGAIEETLKGHPSSQLKKTLKELRTHFNYAEYPGAIVCGVDGVVVKCHGNSTAKALLSGILGAYELVEKGTVDLLREGLINNALDFRDLKNLMLND